MTDTTADIAAIRDALAAVPRKQWHAYVHPLQPEELRGYADVVGTNRDDDVAENVPLPLASYIAACHPERIARLLDALESEMEDAARWRWLRCQGGWPESEAAMINATAYDFDAMADAGMRYSE